MSNETELFRLRPEHIERIRRKAGGDAINTVTATTTELQAGFQLGVNRVLDILREGFVNETTTS
jgi:hypothetical protein